MPNPSSNHKAEEQTELPLFDSPAPGSMPPPDQSITGKTRSFLDWNESVLASACAHLAKDWDQKGALDLSDCLVIVPTRNAGRRLRESLALFASEYEAAVIPPLVTTQDFLVAPERNSDSNPVAAQHITPLIWSALLLEINLNQFRRIYPVDPVERDLHWAMKTAGEILEVRNLLAESGLTFSTASEKLAELEMEPGRWKELAELEALAIERTEKLGFRDDSTSRIIASTRGKLPSGIKRIPVIATPDLRPVSISALNYYSNSHTIEILIHAAEEFSERFDDWGRPHPDQWLNAEIPILKPERSIHQAATPSAQAALAFSLINDLKNPAETVAIGVPDPELVSPLQQTAAGHGWTTHDPAGLPVSRHGIYYLLEQTERLVDTGSFDAAAQLFRCPDFAKACVDSLGLPDDSNFGPVALLRLVDELTTTALPHRLSDAIAGARRSFYKKPELEKALRWVEAWLDRFKKKEFGETLITYLSEVFAARSFSVNEGTHGAFSEVADAVLEADAALRAVGSTFQKKLTPPGKFQLVLELIRERRLYEERRIRDIDLQGWLELLWEDAPHLIITGMNDNFVPEAIVGHAFLPDSARRVLRIFHNDDRFARDAYLLSSAVASRSENGRRLDLIFGRESDSNDPLRPSRLLFQCPDSSLPERTLHLFSEGESGERPVARSVAFPLRPRPLTPDNSVFQRLSVSALKQYLSCPFRFYLKQGLRMNTIETNKREMDAADFGNLVHETLDRFGMDDSINQSSEPDEILQYFQRTLDTILEESYGNSLSTPVVIQREAARKRLAWWSEVEAEQRKEGWEIAGCEIEFGYDDKWPFEIDGTKIRGRIDRIDEHPEHGFRVLDFKTISPFREGSLKTVDQYHLVPLKKAEDPEEMPDWITCENQESKICRWADLQVPLYVLAMQQKHPGSPVIAGYGTLGKTEAEVRVDTWESLDADLLAFAEACAKGIIGAVRDETFWPPSDDAPPWDEFLDHLAPDPAVAVDMTLLNR